MDVLPLASSNDIMMRLRFYERWIAYDFLMMLHKWRGCVTFTQS